VALSPGAGTTGASEPVFPDTGEGVAEVGSGSAGSESDDGREDGSVAGGGLVTGAVRGLVTGGAVGLLAGGAVGGLLAGGVVGGCWVGGSEEGGSAASGDDGGWVGVGVLLAES
jgi:hypothetical protein